MSRRMIGRRNSVIALALVLGVSGLSALAWQVTLDAGRARLSRGLVDKLTVKDGPLEQLAETAEILSRLQPAVEALTPTADTLESAVDTLNRMVNSLSAITDRIPRRRAARSAVRAKPDVGDDSVDE